MMVDLTQDTQIPDPNVSKHGRLVIAGTGIVSLAHMTTETLAHVRSADIVFYHATTGVTATQIRRLNSNAVDLYAYYGEGKIRTATYVQMAELMLREVRKGLYVVGLFHGHPGFFVKAGRRALAIARIEGHATHLLPGISAPDCLFADLRIDPGVIGVQIMKASHVLRRDAQVATNNHLILLQVNSVGDDTFSYTGYKKAKLDGLFERLINIYGEDHEAVYYVAPVFPGFDPIISTRALRAYRELRVRDTVSASTLYLPPLGVALSSLTALQAFDNTEPYSPHEMHIIDELETHCPPKEYRKRAASAAMMHVMSRLATSPSALFRFRNAPTEFVDEYSDLDLDEKQALIRRSLPEMRNVTDERDSQDQVVSNTVESGDGSKAARTEADPSAQLAMWWTPQRQSLCIGDREFIHEGPTNTHPSHDVAHLMVAANGRLQWLPEGDKAVIKIAEYNAVFLEHLLNETYNDIISGACNLPKGFERALLHARWFVETHYAPFPLLAEEAYSQFCRHVDPAKITRLCIYFFEQKRAERRDPDFMSKRWELTFNCDSDPAVADEKAVEFKAAVSLQLSRLVR